jgi:hypothetical protein
MTVRRILLIAGVLAGGASGASGQRPGFPVLYAPAHTPVVGGAVEFGVGGGTAGTGTLVSAGGRLNLSLGVRWQVMAGAAWVGAGEEGVEDGVAFQGTIAMRLREPRPTIGVNVQAGASVLDMDAVSILDVPLGVGIGLYGPTPLGPAEFFVAPRLQVRRFDVAGGDDETVAGGGVSAGLSYTHASAQVGFSISGDLLVMRDPAEDAVRATGALGVTVHMLRLR